MRISILLSSLRFRTLGSSAQLPPNLKRHTQFVKIIRPLEEKINTLFLALFVDVDGDSLLILPLGGVVLVGIERSLNTCGLELEVYTGVTGWPSVK